jgi:hypothetical protein
VEGAALVAGGDGFADVGREDPGGAADVQDPAFAAEQDGDDVRVAGDLPDGGGRDGPVKVNEPVPGMAAVVPVR